MLPTHAFKPFVLLSVIVAFCLILPPGVFGQNEGVHITNSESDTLMSIQNESISIQLEEGTGRVASRSFQINRVGAFRTQEPLLHVLDSGNVGFGTTDPQSTIHLAPGKDLFFAGESDADTLMHVNPNGININLGGESRVASRSFQINRVGAFREIAPLLTAQGETGNVGIGVNNPVELLDVGGGLRIGYSESQNPGTLRFNSEFSTFEGFNGAGWIEFGSGGGGGSLWNQNGTDIFYEAGKVGIGTSTPQSVLDVRGDGFTFLSTRTLSGRITTEMGHYENTGVGFINTFGQNDNIVATLGGSHAGLLKLMDAQSNDKIFLGVEEGVDELGAYSIGVLNTFGANTSNVGIGSWGGADYGAIFVRDNYGSDKIVLGTNANLGQIHLNAPGGTPNIKLGGSSIPDDGRIDIYDANGESVVALFADLYRGFIETRASDGSLNTFLSTTENGSRGLMGVADEESISRAEMFINAERAGVIQTFGPNGYQNLFLGSRGDGNQGEITIRDHNDHSKISLFSDYDPELYQSAGQIDVMGHQSLNVGIGSFDKDFGLIYLRDDQDADKVMLHTSNNTGQITTWGPQGSRNFYAGDNGAQDEGVVVAYDSSSYEKVALWATDVGVLYTRGPNNGINVYLSGTNDGNDGWISTYNAAEQKSSELVAGPDGGIINLYAAGSDVPSVHGSITPEGSGYFYSDVIASGTRLRSEPNMIYQYGAMTGPEVAIYTRGTARLVNGQARLELPDHFREMADETGLTVQVTPLSPESNGLAVVSKSLNGIEVRELMKGTGTYEFDWEVKSIRRDAVDFKVRQEIRRIQSPSPVEFRQVEVDLKNPARTGGK